MSKKPIIAISRASETDAVDEGAALLDMELPAGAVAGLDGSVLLHLDYPVTLRGASGDEEIDQLCLHPLSGVEMRKVFGAKDSPKMMLSLACGIGPARMALLHAKADAADMSAAASVVAEMVGFGEGLPENVVQYADGNIGLPLHKPVVLDDGQEFNDLLFHRLTGADLDALKRTTGVQTLVTLLARSLRQPLKKMDEMFDLMSARDIVSAQRVTGFLSGSGHRTGR